jgi:peptide deformylase
LLSQIFQHETDHLDGVLFIDKATNLIEITKEELEKYQKNHVK